MFENDVKFVHFVQRKTSSNHSLSSFLNAKWLKEGKKKRRNQFQEVLCDSALIFLELSSSCNKKKNLKSAIEFADKFNLITQREYKKLFFFFFFFYWLPLESSQLYLQRRSKKEKQDEEEETTVNNNISFQHLTYE